MGHLRARVRVTRTLPALLFVAAVLVGTPHCEQPTEITLSLSTDVACSQFKGSTITVGPASQVETMPPQSVTQGCGTAGNLGTIVVVPSGSKNAEVVVKVVGGDGRDPTSCAAPAYGTGCIVSRRSLAFLPHTPLVLDIPLEQACNGVVCPTDETCVNGACTSSTIENPGACTGAGTCGDGILKPANAPPEPPSPLVCGDTAGLEPAAAWPMLGYCPTHIGRGPNTGPKTGHVRWSATVGPAVPHPSLSTGIAIAADGTAYAGGGDGKLYAFSPAGKETLAAQVGKGSFVNAVPAIAQNGTIYFGNQDTNFYAVTPAGKVLWQHAVGGRLFTSATVGGDGTIYVGGSSGEHAAFALSADGAEVWKFATGGDVDSSPAIGFDGTVYVGSEDANMYALSSKGQKLWAFADAESGAQTPVIATDGTVYFNGKGSICGVDSKGKLTWVTPTNGDATIPAIGWDGTVYAGSAGGDFYAFEPTRGKVKWQVSLGAFDTANQPTIGGDGTIYIGTTPGVFYALTPSGSTLWKLSVGGAVHGPAAITSDGALYFGSQDGVLHAIGP